MKGTLSFKKSVGCYSILSHDARYQRVGGEAQADIATYRNMKTTNLRIGTHKTLQRY